MTAHKTEEGSVASQPVNMSAFSLYIVFLFFGYVSSDGCTISNVDMSALAGLPWIEQYESASGRALYKISLCTPLTDTSCSNAAVCNVSSEDASKSTNLALWPGLGAMHLNETVTMGFNAKLLTLEGDTCTAGSSDKWKTNILFKCGKTLGSPRYLLQTSCEIFFEWYSTVACKNPSPVKEARCYLYDSNHKRRDISHLIKRTGGYLVEGSEDGQSIYFNPCREMTPSSGTTDVLKNCPPGAAACIITINSTISAGSLSDNSHLKQTGNGDLLLEYTLGSDCATSTKKWTASIQLNCPLKGKNSAPKLLSSLNCHLAILWETDFACPEDSFTSSTCMLNNDTHGVDVDLTPITAVSKMYSLNGNTYNYTMNICGSVGAACPGHDEADNTAVCQIDAALSTTPTGHSLGRSNQTTLRAADGNLTLTYRGGEICHDDFHRETIINFICNRTAGKGYPIRYSEVEHCIYVFDWPTKYACFGADAALSCQAEDGKKLFDLSQLNRDEGANWRAVVSVEAELKSLFFINVCGQVLTSGKCPSSAAVCKQTNEEFINLGQFTSGPVFDSSTNKLTLTYDRGQHCGDSGTYSSVFSMICAPGVTSDPTLVEVAEGCRYEFEWRTSAACVQKHVTGDNCQVLDTELGLGINLSPLKKTGNLAYYNVTNNVNNDHYYINVCGAVTGAPCDAPNTAACQRENAGAHRHYNLGQSASSLGYFDGLVKLRYKNGEAYGGGELRETEISFICNENATTGMPRFASETDHTYLFEWETHLACMIDTTSCVVRDSNGHQYDLSRGAHTGSNANLEAVLDTEKAGSDIIYFNLCHELTQEPVLCTAGAAACKVNSQGQVLVGNLGQFRSSPIESNGILFLNYTSGEVCSSTTDSTALYSTVLKLRCSTNPGSPRVVGSELCVTVIEVDTPAACPLGDVTSDNMTSCSIHDKNSEFTFDLSPLKTNGKKHYYEVTNGHDLYNVSICSGLSTCGTNSPPNQAAVCAPDGTALGLVNSGALSYIGESVTLRYSATGTTQTVIEFECDRSIPHGNPVYRKLEDGIYYFRFSTALVCPPAYVECLVTDASGREYDLTVLRQRGNIEIPSGGATYLLRVCGPLENTLESYNCPANSGACEIIGNERFGLGLVQSGPVVSGTGTVTLHYQGGSTCSDGVTRSARILFECYHVEDAPIAKPTNNECEMLFLWRTPAACPVQKNIGTGCEVSDPMYGMHFNMNPLHKASGDFRVNVTKYSYEINVCGSLNEDGSPECTGKGACQTWQDTTTHHVSLGNSNRLLTYRDGEVQLLYSGGEKCHDSKYERKTIITFTCDHKKYGSDGPDWSLETEDCMYMFNWPTLLACDPNAATTKVNDCKVTTDGKTYDLSPLLRSSGNYMVPGGDTTTYYINVCFLLVHGKGMACPPGSTACAVQLQKNETKTYQQIGQLSNQNITVLSNSVQLRYSNGTSCGTTITLTCNSIKLDSEPEFDHADGCNYYFTWDTYAACALKTPEHHGNCKITNPMTGYQFDLSGLGNLHGYSLNDTAIKEGYVYDINICKAVDSNSICGPTSGCCQRKYGDPTFKRNCGIFTNQLTYASRLLSLNYTGGDKCNHVKWNRSTQIDFVCNEDAGVGSPVFVKEDDDCNYFISWHTDRVCEKQVSCSALLQGEKVDLSSLISVHGFHTAVVTPGAPQQSPSTAYYINVCRPLNPIQGVLCPAGSAVCKVEPDKSPVSLGRVMQPPSVSGKNLMIRYENGDACRNTSTWSSNVTFTCQHGLHQGTAQLEAVNEQTCEYIFTWPTNLVCPTHDELDSADCIYTDTRTQYTHNFKALGGTTTALSTTDGTLYVAPCGSISDGAEKCGKDASVCLVKNNGDVLVYGRDGPVSFVQETDIKMVYNNGDLCDTAKDKKAMAIVLFSCPTGNDVSDKPYISSNLGCTVVISLPTPHACTPVVQSCEFSEGGHMYDLTPLSRSTGQWQLTDTEGNMFWLNLCRSVHSGPAGCPNTAAACWKPKDLSSATMLGSVRSQATTYDDATKTLIVSYYYINGICRHNGRRSLDMQTTVRFHFSCGQVIGRPVARKRDSGSGQCSFDFDWVTSVACPEKRFPLIVNKGILTDPISQKTITLQDIFSGSQSQKMENNDLFEFDLVNGVTGCGNGLTTNPAVCKTKHQPNGASLMPLGNLEPQQFFLKGEVLELYLTSDEPCAKTDKSIKATSTIEFKCAFDNKTKVEYVYHSPKCNYFFDWYTPTICSFLQVTPDTQGSIRMPKPSTMGIMVGVFLAAIFLCVLAIVFHKPERREAFKSRVRRLFRRGRSGPAYRYSSLSAAADEDGTDSSMGLYGSNTGRSLPAFHDDSDDDLLL